MLGTIIKWLGLLGAALLIGSCGGGSAPDTWPPQPQAAAATQPAITATQLMDWAEAHYPQYFAPGGQAQGYLAPYTYRYYPQTHNYLGVSTGSSDVAIYVYGDINGWAATPLRVGTLADYGCTVLPQDCAAPGAPVIGTATAGDASASIAFAAPASAGSSAITRYDATCTAGTGFVSTGTAASSPISVTGMTNNKQYSCTVTATNSWGTGPASGGVNVTPAAAVAQTPLLALAANTTISLDTCGGTVGAGVPDFYKNYFRCSNRSLSADGKSVVFSFYSLPPYSSPYYPTSHPNYLAWATDRAQSVQCGAGQKPGTNGCYLKNPNTLAQQSFTLTIPLNPVARGIDVNASASQINNTSGDPLDYSGAVIGVATNGIGLFSAFAAPGDDINQEAYTFDSHEGHPQGSGVYHYHAYSPGPLEVMRKAGFSTSVTPGSPAGGVEFYGITCDGVPILGVTELDGTTPAGLLDAQGGHVHDMKDKAGTTHFTGRYHVHLSPSPIGTNTKAYRFVPELRYYSTCTSS
jgi:hypothetical protein